MLTTVEAEIDVDGQVEFLEPIRVTKRTRALVTLLDDPKQEQQGNSAALLRSLKENPLPPSARPTKEEIEEHVAEVRRMREEWD